MNQALLDELTTDPEVLGYAPHIASGNDAAILALITDETKYTRFGWVSVPALNKWCSTRNSEYNLVKTRAANPADPFYAAADAIVRALARSSQDRAMDLSDPEIMGLLNAWVFADQDPITGASAARDALIALGTYPASRAEVLGLSVSIQEIANTLRP